MFVIPQHFHLDYSYYFFILDYLLFFYAGEVSLEVKNTSQKKQ